MVKMSGTGGASGKSKPLPKTEEPESESKNVTFVGTPKAQALIAKAKAKLLMSKVAFINRCIEDYGPELLESAGDSSEKNPSLSARLRYLEEAVIAWAYYELLTDEWDGDTATLKAHQTILNNTTKKQWHNSRGLKDILAVAKDNPKTAGTTRHQWQTLQRRRKEFLALTREEFLKLKG